MKYWIFKIHFAQLTNNPVVRHLNRQKTCFPSLSRLWHFPLTSSLSPLSTTLLCAPQNKSGFWAQGMTDKYIQAYTSVHKRGMKKGNNTSLMWVIHRHFRTSSFSNNIGTMTTLVSAQEPPTLGWRRSTKQEEGHTSLYLQPAWVHVQTGCKPRPWLEVLLSSPAPHQRTKTL